MTEDEMVRWHRRLNEHEFGKTLGDGEGQGSLGAAVHGVAKSRHDGVNRDNTCETDPGLTGSLLPKRAFMFQHAECFY